MEQKPCRNFCSVCTCPISCFQTLQRVGHEFQLGAKLVRKHLHNHGKLARSIFFNDSPQTRDTIVNLVNRVTYRGICDYIGYLSKGRKSITFRLEFPPQPMARLINATRVHRIPVLS